jgi:hypothetical protein
LTSKDVILLLGARKLILIIILMSKSSALVEEVGEVYRSAKKTKSKEMLVSRRDGLARHVELAR